MPPKIVAWGMNDGPPVMAAMASMLNWRCDRTPPSSGGSSQREILNVEGDMDSARLMLQ